MNVPGQDKNALVVDAETALQEERDALGLAGSEQPAALCLSGGGIRSAAVCLGVLQAFARRGLLPEFHYLSTVSGGGYTGGWLTRLIADQNDRDRGSGKSEGIVRAQAILAEKVASRQPELDRLRRFTNFLTPNPGLASLDTWAGIVLWLRNTFINWTLFLPVMLSIAAVPVLYFTLVCAMARPDAMPAWLPAWLLFAIALLGLLVSVCVTLRELPSYKKPEVDPTAVAAGAAAPEIRAGRARPVEKKFGASASAIRFRIVVPVLVWAFLLPLALAPVLHRPQAMQTVAQILDRSCPAEPSVTVAPQCRTQNSHSLPELSTTWPAMLLWLAPVGAFLVAVAAYVGMGITSAARFAVLRANWLAWIGSAAVSALLLGAGIHLVVGADAAWLALAAPLGIVVMEILRSALYVAFRQDGLRSDLDREWLARLSANKLRFVLAFAVLGVVTVVLPWVIFSGRTTFGSLAAAVSALVSGPVAALLGKSATTLFSRSRQADGKAAKMPFDWLLVAAAVLFGVTIMTVLGNAVEYLGSTAAREIGDAPGANAPIRAALAAMLALIMVMALIIAFVGRRINLNRFSMHAVYRNRIVRAFMGSARHDHQPDRYTSFDPLDDLRVADAFDRTGPARRLFPVINVALNRTTGKDTARAARKAVSFTITPLRCGGASLLRTEKGEPWLKDGAYVRTGDYAGSEKEVGEDDSSRGIRLGTAVTLSGAAVSPNMGYHSSPLIAFLMTLFNVRLGAWLPNPATVTNKHSALQSGPRNGVKTILSELVGMSSDDSSFVYLSDGGHFDNLGLYEMLRRRCSRIVVVDAAQDEAYAYYDLGTVLQRARIDFGIEVNFLQSVAVGKPALPLQGAYASVAYPETQDQPAATGSIIYLKSWLPGDAPAPLRAFQALKANFPHDTTANQFFTETDFESYRALGDYLADQMLEKTKIAAEAGLGQVASKVSGLERVFFGAERLHNASA